MSGHDYCAVNGLKHNAFATNSGPAQGISGGAYRRSAGRLPVAPEPTLDDVPVWLQRTAMSEIRLPIGNISPASSPWRVFFLALFAKAVEWLI